jgi:sulfide:quinone oxidoreductase
VVALGADLDPAATPGLLAAGHEFYTESGAFALRDVLAGFAGGRVVVGVTSTPFKCPPAPSETVLLMDDHLVQKGIRDRAEIALVMPMPVPIPPSPQASQALLQAFEERGIAFHGEQLVREVDPATKVARLMSGDELPFDLFLGIPVHRVPPVVEESGMTVDGWIPVDPRTLETSFPDVYAVGDVTSVGTPKAGVFSERQAVVVADRIIARARGEQELAEFGGAGICYLEFGGGQVAVVEAVFEPGQPPRGDYSPPSEDFMADKREFGTSRVQRWFGRSWP